MEFVILPLVRIDYLYNSFIPTNKKKQQKYAYMHKTNSQYKQYGDTKEEDTVSTYIWINYNYVSIKY